MSYYARPKLARQLAQVVLSSKPGGVASSGLFLAAPRRTGKSTFMREDLKPTLESAGAVVIYTDLWEDRSKDPAELIAQAIRGEVERHAGLVLKLARKAGMEKVAVGGMSFSLDKVGVNGQVSLSQALETLSDEVRKPIVLIIDEAQQTAVSDKGQNALFSLKAARDELNSSGHFGLRIIATGSNSDKLAALRSSKGQAFYLAPIKPLPHLDMGYVEWFCANAELAGPLDPTEVMELFRASSFRPEVLGAAADDVRLEFGLEPELVRDAFEKAVREQLRQADANNLQVVRALTPLQSSVLAVLAERGDAYAPFEEPTIAAYTHLMQVRSPSSKVVPDQSNVQSALTALQEKGLIWKEARGVYAVEEASLRELMKREGLLNDVLSEEQAKEAAGQLRAERARLADAAPGTEADGGDAAGGVASMRPTTG